MSKSATPSTPAGQVPQVTVTSCSAAWWSGVGATAKTDAKIALAGLETFGVTLEPFIVGSLALGVTTLDTAIISAVNANGKLNAAQKQALTTMITTGGAALDTALTAKLTSMLAGSTPSPTLLAFVKILVADGIGSFLPPALDAVLEATEGPAAMSSAAGTGAVAALGDVTAHVDGHA